jgi:glycosyltransferase involved in cell wall biosynthesis
MLTVLLPSHNEPYIHELMDKVEHETCAKQIVVFNDRYGQGKGLALREALKEAKGDYFVFLDGDGDITPYEINKLLLYLNEYDVVVGRKQPCGSWKRRLLTKLSRLYIRIMFGIGVDTQTGIKVFNYKPEWCANGWAFDIEILAKAKKSGKRIIEVPITARISDSKGIKVVWNTLLESLIIWYRL